jgi:hypothetical protein
MELHCIARSTFIDLGKQRSHGTLITILIPRETILTPFWDENAKLDTLQ